MRTIPDILSSISNPFLDQTFSVSSGGGSAANAARQIANRVDAAFGEYHGAETDAAAGSLMDASARLTLSNQRGDFFRRKLYSENSAVADGKAAAFARPARFGVEVLKPASSVTLASDSLSTTSERAARARSYRFEINTRGESHNVDVRVTQWDTNESMLKKVAGAINDLGIGVRAEVGVNLHARTTRLYVNGITQSDLSSVSVRDVGGSLLDQINLNSTRRAPLADPVPEEIEDLTMDEINAGRETTQGGILRFNDDSEIRVRGTLMSGDTNRVALLENLGLNPRERRAFPQNAEDMYEEFHANGYATPAVAPSSPRAAGAVEGEYQGSLTIAGAGRTDAVISQDRDAAAEGVSGLAASVNGFANALSGFPAFSSALSALGNALNDASGRLGEAGFDNEGILSGGAFEVDKKIFDSRMKNSPVETAMLFGAPGGAARGSLFAAMLARYAPMTGFSGALDIASGAGNPGILLDHSG